MNSAEHRNYLHDLSLRLVRLSGNERIRKRIPGAGGGDAFNVLDEVPQFTLDQLLAGKVLELTPYPNIEEVLKDEKTQEFEDAFNELREEEGSQRQGARQKGKGTKSIVTRLVLEPVRKKVKHVKMQQVKQ